jgi:hypothetical protein
VSKGGSSLAKVLVVDDAAFMRINIVQELLQN